jgi:hypothetical protein
LSEILRVRKCFFNISFSYREKDCSSLIFLIPSLISFVFTILNGYARKDERSHVALGVLQLLFGDLISGILMLCSGGGCENAKKS